METVGAPYLFNLSLMALTFATISALVMLLRQTMGGTLSKFDVFLISTYISFGFADGLAAIIPPLVAMFDAPIPIVWALSGIGAAGLVGSFLLLALQRRGAVLQGSGHIPFTQQIAYVLRGLACAILLFNALPTPFQGAGPFALGMTISFAGLLWGFVRRVTSLLASDDWDPNRG